MSMMLRVEVTTYRWSLMAEEVQVRERRSLLHNFHPLRKSDGDANVL